MLELNEKLIFLDLEAPNAQAVIDLLAGAMHAQGLVSSLYGRQTIERELNHPTGLPTSPWCIAFPHADAEGVHRSALGFASLRFPVIFKNMADPDEDLEVLLVFMLANNNPEEQVQTLRNLALVFGQPEKLTALRSLSTPEQTTTWLRSELNLN